MNTFTGKSLLERISPADASVSQRKGDTDAQGSHTHIGSGKQQKTPATSTSQLSTSGTAIGQLSQSSPISSTVPENKKRKRRAADDGEAERVKPRVEPEKLLAPWFPCTYRGDSLPPCASYSDRYAA